GRGQEEEQRTEAGEAQGWPLHRGQGSEEGRAVQVPEPGRLGSHQQVRQGGLVLQAHLHRAALAEPSWLPLWPQHRLLGRRDPEAVRQVPPQRRLQGQGRQGHRGCRVPGQAGEEGEVPKEDEVKDEVLEIIPRKVRLLGYLAVVAAGVVYSALLAGFGAAVTAGVIPSIPVWVVVAGAVYGALSTNAAVVALFNLPKPAKRGGK